MARNENWQTTKLKERENAGDQVTIGVSFVSNWFRAWHEFSGPITKRSKEKSWQSWTTLDIQLKITLRQSPTAIKV